MNSMTIGILAKKSDVRTDTIRYYEKLGLLLPEERSKAGYRLYNDNSMRIVKFIHWNKSTILLTLKASQTATCQDMLERTDQKLEEAKANLKRLNNIHSALEKLLEACPGGKMPLSECPILDYLYPQ